MARYFCFTFKLLIKLWKTTNRKPLITKKNIHPPKTHPARIPKTMKKKVAGIILAISRADKAANLPTVTKTPPTIKDQKKAMPAASTVNKYTHGNNYR